MIDNNFTKYDIPGKIVAEFVLLPIDGRKSFYGKCRVIETEQVLYLQSYDIIVCCWDKKRKIFNKLWDDYSVTTMRHINSFMHFIGLPSCHGKHWWNALSYGIEYTVSELLNIV